VDKPRGSVAGAKPSKPVDLRDRLRGVEPASPEMSQQADTSMSGWRYTPKRRRRRR